MADVGCTILCRLGTSREADGGNVLRTASPVTANPALAEETTKLVAAGGHTFFAVPVQHNGVPFSGLCSSCRLAVPVANLVSVKHHNHVNRRETCGRQCQAGEMTSEASCFAGVVQRKRTVADLHVNAEGLRVTLSGVEVACASYHDGMQVLQHSSISILLSSSGSATLQVARGVPPHSWCALEQVCGARGGGDGAAQGMFLALHPQHVFMLALETPDKRNMCISLIRKVRRPVHPLLVSPLRNRPASGTECELPRSCLPACSRRWLARQGTHWRGPVNTRDWPADIVVAHTLFRQAGRPIDLSNQPTICGALRLEQYLEHGNDASELLRTMIVWDVDHCRHCLLFTST